MKHILTVLVLCLLFSVTYTQSTNDQNISTAESEEGDTRVKGTIKWENKLSAGLSLTSGNSDLLNLNTALNINRNRLWVDELDFKAQADWRTDAGVQTYLKVTTAFRYGHSFTKKIYGFAGISADSDYAALVSYNLYPNLGAGYWFFDTAKIKLMNELGTGYNYYRYHDQTTSESFGLYYRLFLEWVILDNVVWNNSFTIKPAWADFSDLVLNNTSQVKIKIQKNLDLLVTHTFDFDNIPASGAAKSDATFSTGLEWKF